MIALLVFYHRTALWQRTNQPRASIACVMKGLSWGRDKVRAVRSLLLKAGLIEDALCRDATTERVKGWFVKVRYFHPTDFQGGGSTEGNFHPPDFTTGGEIRGAKCFQGW
jgi:hypothetical protein